MDGVEQEIGDQPEREIESLRREIDQYPERAMVVRRNPGSEDLFILFMGKDVARENLRIGAAVPELLADMKALTFYRDAGLMKCNLVMVRDYYRFFYHAGINRDVATFDAVLQVFRQRQEDMPDVRRSATLGSSAGGYAALLFGHHLGVDTVFAFAPQTLIDADKLREMSGRDELWRIPEEHRDLSLLLSRHNGRTRYEVYYCQDNDEDRGFAHRLRDCPGIHLHPQPGDTHFVLSQMHRDGQLPTFLAGSVNPEAAGSRSD